MLKSGVKKLVILIGDIVLLYIGLGIVLIVRYRLFPDAIPFSLNQLWDLHKIPFLIVHMLWIGIFYSAGLYDWGLLTRQSARLGRTVINAMLANALIAMGLFYFVPYFIITPKINLVMDSLVVGLFLWGWRAFLVQHATRSSKVNVLFLGSTQETKAFAEHVEAVPSWGYFVVGVLDHAEFKQ